MNVSYKGIKQAFPPENQEKMDAKFAKLAKILDQGGQREAHVIVKQERHLHHAEITVYFHDHQLVSEGSDTDVFTALSGALDKLEAQAHKQVEKFREKTRRKGNGLADLVDGAAPAAEAGRRVEAGDKVEPRVFRMNHHNGHKPMTLDEALLEMGHDRASQDRTYMVYRDSENQTMSVLVRRRDGHFDLIESLGG